jgi:hypothetical protein
MSGKRHNRKRSIQDTPVDLSKMKMALKYLSSLKEELDGIQETEGEMEAVMQHVHALQKILETAKKPVREVLCLSHTGSSSLRQKVNFSSATKNDLENLCVIEKDFDFIPEGVEMLLTKRDAPEEFASLLVRLQDVYDHVNMDVRSNYARDQIVYYHPGTV